MMALDEARAKQLLRDHGLPTPRGIVVDSAAQALESPLAAGGPTVVKALVPTGRRGKAGAVRMADGPKRCAAQVAELLGSVVLGHEVRSAYVEERVDIARELYVSFVLQDGMPVLLVSSQGGVDIEEVAHGAILRLSIAPLDGLTDWACIDLWHRAGIRGAMLPRLGALTRRLYEAFRAMDALVLEINPLAVDSQGRLHLVGAMLGLDDSALFRHPGLAASAALPTHPRERAVAIANLEGGEGECRYVELQGDIGLLVGGGGAGLYQHDLIVSLGGAPANHCVTPPTSGDDRKLKAVIRAILDNPAVRGLLVGFNFAQMARADIRVKALVEVLDERPGAMSHLPIVIRMFGAGEADARALVQARPHVHYMPRGSSLEDAARLIVQRVAQRTSEERT